MSNVVNTYGDPPFSENRLPTADELQLDYPRNHGILGRPQYHPYDYDKHRLYQHLLFEYTNATSLIEAVRQHHHQIPEKYSSGEKTGSFSATTSRDQHMTSQDNQEIAKQIAYYKIGCRELFRHAIRCLRLLPSVARRASVLQPNTHSMWEQASKQYRDCQRQLAQLYQSYVEEEKEEGDNQQKKAKNNRPRANTQKKSQSTSTKKPLISSSKDNPYSLAALWFEIDVLRWELSQVCTTKSASEPRGTFLNRAEHQIRNDTSDTTNEKTSPNDSANGGGRTSGSKKEKSVVSSHDLWKRDVNEIIDHIDNEAHTDVTGKNPRTGPHFIIKSSDHNTFDETTTSELYGKVEDLRHKLQERRTAQYSQGDASIPPEWNEPSAFFGTAGYRKDFFGDDVDTEKEHVKKKKSPSRSQQRRRGGRRSSSSTSTGSSSKRRTPRKPPTQQSEKQHKNFSRGGKVNSSSSKKRSDVTDSADAAAELAEEFEPLDSTIRQALYQERKRKKSLASKRSNDLRLTDDKVLYDCVMDVLDDSQEENSNHSESSTFERAFQNVLKNQ